jgi:hypothetical protein
LPPAGLGTQEQVALGQEDLDLVAVLVLTHGDRLPQRAAVGRGQWPGDGLGVGQGVAAQDDHLGMAGTRRVAYHPDLPDGQEGGDPFSLGLQVGDLAAGRHPDPELLAGPGQPAAGDPWDAVVGGGQLGMAAGQRPPPPQVRPEQGMSERLAGPADHRHHEGGGHDQPLRTLPAQPVAQPHIGRRHQGDQGHL